MKKWIKRILITVFVFYTLLCTLVYFFQEKMIFHPEKLAADYVFEFDLPHQEFTILTEDKKALSALYFQADSSKGLILHFHGNAGSIANCGYQAKLYTQVGYDYFIYDYRGFGKSEGKINSQEELITDAETVYDFVKSSFPDKKITIEGFSIGTGIATQVAAKREIEQLILLAPYASLKVLSFDKYPFLPSFILKYPLRTDEVLPTINAPITLIHGSADEVIPLSNSLELKKRLKQGDLLIEVPDYHHNDIIESPAYLSFLKTLK